MKQLMLGIALAMSNGKTEVAALLREKGAHD
jgi:hypothetical protein